MKNRVGNRIVTKEGFTIIITHYYSWNNITVEFEDGTIKENVFYSAFKNGQIRKPVSRVGEVHKSAEGLIFKIINFKNTNDVDIKFKDGLILKNRTYSNIKTGSISHPFHKSVLNIGYKGIGSYSSTDKKIYSKWLSMLKRCYDGKNYIKNESYKDVTVCEEWHNFQNFAIWFEDNYNPETMEGWHLDKDIICPECKEYSSENCYFLPPKINNIFSSRSNRNELPKGIYPRYNGYCSYISIYGKNTYLGDYKTIEEAHSVYYKAKKDYIKEVADSLKDKISKRVYEAMVNFDIDNF